MPLPAATPTTFRDKLLGAFDTFWNGRTPIGWEGRVFDPQPHEAYVLPFVREGPDPESYVGVGVWQISGTFTVRIQTRGQDAPDALVVYRDAVGDFMATQSRELDEGFLRRTRFNSLSPDGVWLRLDATADWTYFTSRAHAAP